MNFQLHPRLEQDCIEIGRLSLSRLLLMNDSQYPWCILVPEREDISEIYQLSPTDQQQLQQESCLLSKTLAEIYNADKMNIAAIGNMVPQLHIHHIVRYRNDRAWPAPVWGQFDAIPYGKKQLKEQISVIKLAMKAALID
ncbi:HIT family protein [Methylomarinum sp. Ch1-1]|uniref:HIT family protein n=1 Tax=Methylomarinum roseum TaxID=3067653 RepID=A0AAU7NU03_9GAMM|nr:HIT family protein [Methylomarinum sp. Ch1-1]MDP4519877.1 HIT family protein [Methylomarinum sp. Ch1-1]